ncbi:MAG: DnaA regulatory inactivator Hda, partial [Pseudomonadota bacterium]|nr:DnaA regulatory inactivator Hda [Pseudomonadota bacterium]
MRQLLLDIPFLSGPSFSDFIPGVNQELLAYLANWHKTGEKWVYIWGEKGCGKSHLLKAAVNAFIESGEKAGYFESGHIPDLSWLESHDLLALDDTHLLDAEGQVALFVLLNQVKEGKCHLLLSGDNAPSLLKIRPDVSTRLGYGLVFHVHSLTDWDKKEALSAYARSRDLKVSSEIIEYLLNHTQRDMPSLIQLLDTLLMSSLETKRPIT